MSEEKTLQTNADDNGVNNEGTKPLKNDTPSEVPYSRLQEVANQKNVLKDENATLKAQLEEIAQKDAKVREEQLKKNDQHEVLINELKAENEKLKQTYDEYNTYKTNKRKTLVDRLPEHRREFTDGMSLDKLEKFVDTEVKGNTLKTDSSRPGAKDVGEFGGYKSWEELAIKDPKLATKMLEDSTKGYIK